MLDASPGSEAALRLALFAAALTAIALWEQLAPRRSRFPPPRPRRTANLALLGANTVAARLIAPAGVVGVAAAVEARGVGLLHAVSLPAPLAFAAGVLALDLVVYFQHRVFHAVPMLWRFHRVHHADRAFDVTTGVRFHPGEILLSLAIKCGAVAAIGAPPLAVLVFEALLSTTSLFNHGNVAMPAALDRALRRLVVTPDMHRVHHSVIGRETNSNFGFNLPWWDHLFGTYRAQPEAGHQAMTIGLANLQAERPHELRWALAAPFLPATALERP